MSQVPPQDGARFPSSLVLAGAGKMGGAMLDAWLSIGLERDRLAVIDPHAPPALVERLAREGVVLNPLPAERGAPEVLVLAIKPQMLAEAAHGLSPFVAPGTVLVSIMAGKTIADLRHAFPQAQAIARAMPNTPAAIRQGVTGVAVSEAVTPAQRASIQALLEAVGGVEWLPDETLVDAVTALSGSGPAYVFYLTECMAKAGEAVGLDPAAAMRLARATVQGAGALMAANGTEPPDVLRRNVTSPGGTTAAALDVLLRDPGLQSLMTDAVAAAKARAQALSG